MGTTVTKVRERLKPKQVDLDGEHYWVAEGDQLLDDGELELYVEELERREEQRAAAEPGAGFRAGLVVDTADGRPIRWRDGKVLTYCVLKSTFGSNAEYLAARRSVQKAAKAWMDVCGVEFRHVVAKDTSPTTTVDDVVFTVRKIDAGGRFIAAAFFPNDPPARRRVFIDPSFYEPNLGFDRVGVLRHELGHVLGFRHEQIRSEAPAVCPDEDTTGTLNLTDYDPQSVMHYFCGGVGSRQLRLTDVDIAGARQVYGPPLSSFQMVD